MNLQPPDLRVHKFLDRHLSAPLYQFQSVTDPRAQRGRRHSLAKMLWALLYGMLTACRSLREVEELTKEMGPWGRRRVPGPVADTTLYELVTRLPVEPLRQVLHAQVRLLWRQKCLAPMELPCGVVSIDGKGMGALDHDADGQAQKAQHSASGRVYFLQRTLRAVLTSSEAKPCLDQMAIPAKTNETGAFAAFFTTLQQTYGGGNLFELVTVDAGLTSKANADLVAQAHKGYVMALKGSQPELLAEAERLLLPLTKRPASAVTEERAQGMRVRRSLYRTTQIAGYHDWTHLRQALLVRQERWDAKGDCHVEDRYFLTNVHGGRLSAAQWLQVVRGHWGIENDCFWSLDAQFGEDSSPWVTGGRAVEVLGLLRLLAYNLLQLCRKRHLRPRQPGGLRGAPPRWQQLFRWVWLALRLPVYPLVHPGPAG